jgi:hypothetical protein
MNSSTHSSRFLNGTETHCAKRVPAGQVEPGRDARQEELGRDAKKHMCKLKEEKAKK